MLNVFFRKNEHWSCEQFHSGNVETISSCFFYYFPCNKICLVLVLVFGFYKFTCVHINVCVRSNGIGNSLSYSYSFHKISDFYVEGVIVVKSENHIFLCNCFLLCREKSLMPTIIKKNYCEWRAHKSRKNQPKVNGIKKVNSKALNR